MTGDEEFFAGGPWYKIAEQLLKLPLVMDRDKIQVTRDVITLRQFPGI